MISGVAREWIKYGFDATVWAMKYYHEYIYNIAHNI